MLILINMTVAGGYFEGNIKHRVIIAAMIIIRNPKNAGTWWNKRNNRTSSDLLEEKLRHILEIMDRGEKEGYSAADKKRLTELKDELENLNRQIVDESKSGSILNRKECQSRDSG